MKIQGYPNPGEVTGYSIDSNVAAGAGASYSDGRRNPNLLMNAYSGFGSTSNVINNNTFFYPFGATAWTTTTWRNYNMCMQCVDAFDVGTKTITNNTAIGGVYAPLGMAHSSSAVITGNNLQQDTTNYVTVFANKSGVANSSYTINNNHYYQGGSTPFVHADSTGAVTYNTFSQWQSSTGWDSTASGATYTNGLISGTNVGYVANAYETGRGNFAVINFAGATSASLPLGGLGLVNGNTYEVRNAYDWGAGAIATGTYSSGSPNVTVSLSSLTTATPLGMTYTEPNPAPTFAAFIVRKT